MPHAAEEILDLFITRRDLSKMIPLVDPETAKLLLQTYARALDRVFPEDNLYRALILLRDATNTRDESDLRNAVFNAAKYLGLPLPSNHF